MPAELETHADTMLALHLVLRPAKPPRPQYDPLVSPDPEAVPAPGTAERAVQLLRAVSGIEVEYTGFGFLTAVAPRDVWEDLFDSRIWERDGERCFSPPPTIPPEWREVISTAFFPPRFEYCE